MRKPIQVLVFPYRKKKDSQQLEYCLFLREDLDVWQGIAGGVEENETIEECAKRETFEEGGLLKSSQFIKLSSFVSIPSINITGTTWNSQIYVVYEYAFGVYATTDITISDEHSKYKWVSYEEAMNLLYWDSNKNALWELNERLCKKGGNNNDQV